MRILVPTLAWWLLVTASVSCATGVDSFDDPGSPSGDASPSHGGQGSSSGATSSSGASSGGGGSDVDASLGGAEQDAHGGGSGDHASPGVPDDAGGPDWFTLPALDAAAPSPGDAGDDALPSKCASQICFDGFDCLFAGCGTSCQALHCAP